MSREYYRDYVSPVLDSLPSEGMHNLARETLHLLESHPAGLRIIERAAYKGERFRDERLKMQIGGIELENPLLVGAGWDKKGRAVRGLHKLGFSGVEVGSVLAYPQAGNPKPRQFMIGPGVALNRLGFNSPGVQAVVANLERYKRDNIPIGISVGKNKDIEPSLAPKLHADVVRGLFFEAAYFAINVSSPNTPGLRDLQDKAPLTDIVQAVNQTMDLLGKRKPVFVKIAPDLTNTAIDDVMEVVVDNGLTGIIATNTTNNERLKNKYGRGDEAGGLSGNDSEYRHMAIEKVRHIFKEAGEHLEIIGVGGINSAESALDKIKAGAKAIQVVTAIREIGPSLPGRINRGIVEWMEKEGVTSLDEITGQEA